MAKAADAKLVSDPAEESKALILRLAAMPRETEWLEFKGNNKDAEKIGETLSALSNSAALHGQKSGFIVWGVADSDHSIIGTDFRPRETKYSGQDIEHYLGTLLTPHTNLAVRELELDGKYLVIFEIEPARYAPIAYKGQEWVRIGSHNKPLRQFTAIERRLWQAFEKAAFDTAIAMPGLTEQEVESLLWYKDFFSPSRSEAPKTIGEALPRLIRSKMIHDEGSGRFGITNLGALLFARNLNKFESLRRKRLRIVFYKGPTKTESYEERTAGRGYASSFRPLVGFLMSRLPRSEALKNAIRIDRPLYPEIAVRELVANVLIHQDLEVSGAGPMVEIFGDRIEFTNPGRPLEDANRLLDLPPRSRNERVAEQMRKLGICEERGTGIDKVVKAIELWQLPPPDFQVPGENTRAILYAPRDFANMTKIEKVRACFQHAQLLWVSGQQMTNESLRKRLGIDDKNYSMASRVVRETMDAGYVKPYDPANASNRYARYVPFWA